MGNIWLLQESGDQNTEGRTSIRDILNIPPPPPTPSEISSSSTLLRMAANDRFDEWVTDPRNSDRGRRARRTGGRAWNAIRAARKICRSGRARLQHMARRAGGAVRRVFQGAAYRVTGGGGGVFRQTRVRNATLDRPAEQRAGGVRPESIAELELAMASVGLVIPESMALGQQRPRTRPALRRRDRRSNLRA
jgi:hypothetical protein